MAAKSDDLLYSLLPLILIIGVSWFFSFISSRIRKGPQQEADERISQIERDPMKVLFEIDSDAESPKPLQRSPAQAVPGKDSGITLWKPPEPGMQVTPKPIEPKWWGA